MASKRRTDELELQPECEELLKRAKGDVTCNEHEVRARSDDAGPSHQSRGACVDETDPPWPNHKIFLSHSGVQKAFTEHLCKELERVHHFAFFDIREDSLRKGERFYSPLMTAAQRCRVAVLVLSEEFFTKTKWPMMEVNEFVKAQKLDKRVKILPLYFQISRKDLGQRVSQDRWMVAWKVMGSEEKRINVEEWEYALGQIAGNNGMAYGGNTEGEAAFIQRVVKAVCELVPPDVQWDVSHVRSMNELSEPILRKLKDAKPREEYNVQVVGLYGMGGAGKTTISMAICNEMFGDFVGKVCYIEFGKMGVEELLRIVLQQLTGASPAFLNDKHRGQLVYLMKERIHRQKVFLVLDNVLDDHICDAQMFLDIRYCDGSMVLVTARSLDMLMALGIPRDDYLEMPNLEEAGAIDLFLHYTSLCRESMKDEEWRVVRGCVQECYFLKDSDPELGSALSFHYLPLALKVLGIQLRRISNDVLMWEKKLGELRKGRGEMFNMLKNKTHPIFSVLRLGYDALCTEEQHIFLDLALLPPLHWGYAGHWYLESWQWMGIMHEMTKDEIKESVSKLQRMGLLDSFYRGDKLKVSIHDLYKEFAEVESQGGPFEGRHSLVSKEEADGVPKELLKHPPNGSCWPSLKRLVIFNCKVRSLTGAYLRFCRNVELLDLCFCKELEVVDVTGMDNLRCVMVCYCRKLREWIGLEKLHNLAILRFDDVEFMPSLWRNLSSFTALQVLELEGTAEVFWSEVDTFPPDLRACTNLQVLITDIRGVWQRESGVQFFGKHLPKSVCEIHFVGCSRLVGSSPIRSMSLLTNLQVLDLQHCWRIKDLIGLCELTLLQEVDVKASSIGKLPGNMRALEHLQVLDVSKCRSLTSLVGISQCAATLRRLNASGCTKLSNLPDDFSCFLKLEILDLEGCVSIRTLPKGYEMFVGHPGNGTWVLKPGGCFGIIVPLVKMLRLPKKSHLKCVDRCRFRGDSMQSWIDGWKHVNSVAYELLRRVFSGGYWASVHGFWTSMFDKGEVVDFVIRALCEHDDRDVNETHRLRDVVSAVAAVEQNFLYWWTVVVTARCTFAVVMERPKLLSPWSKTLLHSTISFVLPAYVCFLGFSEGRKPLNRMGDDWWFCMAMKALLQKCKDHLEEGIVEGILPVHCREGKKVVDILLGAIVSASGQEIGKDSILWYVPVALAHGWPYRKVFPNFPFESTLRRQPVCSYFFYGEEDDEGEEDGELLFC